MISRIKVISKRGIGEAWKPWQRGVILSTRTVLSLYQELVIDGDFSFLVTGRMTQDALENLFAQVRGCGDDHPSAVHFRNCLKILTMSQFMEVPKSSSYDVDDCPNLIDCLKQVANITTDDDEIPRENLPILDATKIGPEEEKFLFDLAGWVGFKLKTSIEDCSDCKPLLSSPASSLPQASLIVRRSLGKLNHPSNKLYEFIKDAEIYFRENNVCDKSIDKITEDMVEQCEVVCGNCRIHNLREMAVKQFYSLRIRI